MNAKKLGKSAANVITGRFSGNTQACISLNTGAERGQQPGHQEARNSILCDLASQRLGATPFLH